MPIKEFFDKCPACKSMDPRVRVTEGLVSWKMYADEKTHEYRVISANNYFEKKENDEKDENEAWDKEQKQVEKWFKRAYPSFEHAERTEEFLKVQAKKKTKST